MTTYTTALLLVLPLFPLAFVACPTPLPPEPPYVIFPPYGEGGVDAETPSDPLCRVACENLAKIGCPESQPAGRSCASTCTIAGKDGFDLRVICLANAGTADQVRACCPDGQPCSKTRCRER